MPTLTSGSRGRLRAFLILLPLLVTALAVLARAQSAPQGSSQTPDAQAQPDDQPRPTFRVEANFVRVDAIVTKDGVPVTDLTAEDFEVLEDNAPQAISGFERIDVASERRTTTPGREPSTVAESREMAKDARARVFVVFLDRYHTGVDGSHRMKSALGTLLQRIIGPDDLVAVMTPDMSAADISFTRRTQSIAEMLEREWTWGARGQFTRYDPVEEDYLVCFPQVNDPARGQTPAGMNEGARLPAASVAHEMIARRREKLVLDALTDLSVHLRGLREERKAVLVVSDGWALYRPNDQLTLIGEREDVPGRGTPGTNPQGRLVPDSRQQTTGAASRYRCEADRMRLAMLDNRETYMQLMGVANRANVSFYPIDSRGLPVFDSSLADTFTDASGRRGPMDIASDQRLLSDRIGTLQALAENTDGVAVVNRNDIEGGLERVVADLSSYYLLSYYSTNPALDGKFRRITVRVKRPGVVVRARRGYRAATPEEMTGTAEGAGARAGANANSGENAGAAGGGAAAPAMPAAVTAAFSTLGSTRADARLRTRAGVLAGEAPKVWVLAELDQALARSGDWSAGGNAQISLVTRDGSPVSSTTGRFSPGGRTLQVELTPDELPPGEYQVRTRATPADGGLPLYDVSTLRVGEEAGVAEAPRVSMRGPSTGLMYVPTADTRFRRTERLRVEWSVPAGACVASAEVLDQRGRPMSVPVTRVIGPCGEETPGATDAVGAELTLAPFAAADYALRVVVKHGAADHERVAAFRLVP